MDHNKQSTRHCKHVRIGTLNQQRCNFVRKPMNINQSMKNQHILVTGGTGFIGKALCETLTKLGCSITVLTRNPKDKNNLPGNDIRLVSSLDKLVNSEKFDVIINLAGEPISQRWSDKSKAAMVDSRVETTKALVSFMERASHKPSAFISGSAIGVYGTDANTVFSEGSQASDDPVGLFPRELCEQWEAEANKATAIGVRTCLLRTGVVIEKSGGALAKMLFPFEFLLGGRVGTGKQWFSWIHRDDLVRLIIHLINDENIYGPVNATAPNPVTNATFTKALGRAMKRPTLLPLPAFQVKFLFGEMGKTILLAGQKVVPEKALNNGFKFHYSTIDHAFKDIFAK